MGGLGNFLVKTKGWTLSAVTLASVKAQAAWWTQTANGRFAWAETNKIDLSGIAKEKEVCFPQGWSIQEMVPPEGWCVGAYHNDPVEAPTEVWTYTTASGMPWYVEIHDFWTSRPLTRTDFFNVVGRTLNEQYGPSMLGSAQQSQSMFMDWEQVVAARSRVWFPGGKLFDWHGYINHEEGAGELAQAVRQQFASLIHDNTWGSGEPIGTLDLYHMRVMISNIDTGSDGLPSGDPDSVLGIPTSGWYCTIPSSNQPMLVNKVKPEFIARMNIERRSKSV